MTTMTRAKFPLGRIVATPGAIEAMQDSGQTPDFFLAAISPAIGGRWVWRTPSFAQGPCGPGWSFSLDTGSRTMSMALSYKVAIRHRHRLPHYSLRHPNVDWLFILFLDRSSHSPSSSVP